MNKKTTKTNATETIYRCGDCGEIVPRDEACKDHPDASLDPETVTVTAAPAPKKDGGDLFVFGRAFERFEERTLKFRVFRADIERAVALRGKSDAEQDLFEDEMEAKYPRDAYGHSLLFTALVMPFVDPPEAPDFETGFGVWHEEAGYGIATTKAAARAAFTALEDNSGDDDEEW